MKVANRPSTVYVALYWERTRLSFLVEMDLENQVQVRLNKALAAAKARKAAPSVLGPIEETKQRWGVS